MIISKKLIFIVIFISLNTTLSFCNGYKIVPVKDRGFKKQIEPSTMEYIYSRKDNLFEYDHSLLVFDSLITEKPFKMWDKKYDYDILENMKNIKSTHGICNDTNVIKYYISLLDYPEKFYKLIPVADDTTKRTKVLLRLTSLNFNKSKFSYLHSNRWSEKAFHQLIHFTDLSLLQKYSKEIKLRINNRDWNSKRKTDQNNGYYPIDIKYKHELSSLLNLTEAEKEIIRSEDKKSHWVSARLGDLEKEEDIVNKYNKCLDFKKKKEYAEYLYLIGSKRAIEVLVKSFETTDVFKQSGLICESFRSEILRTLTKIHIQDSLFLGIKENLLRASICDEKLKKQYFNDFSSWIKNKYGIILSSNNLYMYKDCSKELNWCDKFPNHNFHTENADIEEMREKLKNK